MADYWGVGSLDCARGQLFFLEASKEEPWDSNSRLFPLWKGAPFALLDA